MRLVYLAAIAAVLSTPAAAVVQTNTLPAGTLVDLSGFSTNTPIAFDDPAFQAAGIASITVTDDPSTNNEFYDGGAFGAGRALFNTEAGELIALDQGTTPDFGSPTFTIDFATPVDAFGFRIADTSNNFATPEIEVFLGAVLLATFPITGPYDASTEFGLTDPDGFDRVVIDVDTVGTGFGFDGAGITDLTVGASVDTVPPIPGPAALPLLVTALALVGFLRRRA